MDIFADREVDFFNTSSSIVAATTTRLRILNDAMRAQFLRGNA
jgi:hypothetical protein